MDPVRKNLYSSLLKGLLNNPPPYEVIENTVHNKLEYLLKRTTLKSAPVSLVLYVNKRCNMDCSFCYNQEILNSKNVKLDDMTPQAFSNILNSPFGKKTLRVAFMGGEPFLNPHLLSYVKQAAEKNKITNIVTNATTLNKKSFNEIFASRLSVLGMSLYANNHDHIALTVSQLNNSKFPYWVQTVADASNLKQLEESVLFCLKIGCKNLILSNYQPYFDRKIENIILSNNHSYFELESRLKKLVGKKMNIQWVNPFDPKKNIIKSCTLPFNYIHIDNHGAIGPCCYRYPDKILYGSIYAPPSWNSDQTILLRKNLLCNTDLPIEHCQNCENLSRDLYGI